MGNALQLCDKLTETHSEQHRLITEADNRDRQLRVRRAEPPYPSEWVTEHEEVAIKELRAQAKELVYKINGMRAMLKETRIEME